ncbi:protein phosphatase 2C containing protein (macronuclear) [Tetrahymena thermophila SB210]|uniref:protein-serine/threonine phosphatase n=1 Tax=Tetrahymena thermophila (strain SB210) TaxID=312017 RepID=Q22XV2_TETTS|nr:protein phosphatase 2C containing protein [Tetrahymena thermophila SB210]EAR90069.1 protein phosphatase 2C containing protein [Tetrahymena thermophila SB210]|eukprot:XP_001010314.1 protein phosphatase 2C containing protein [Tetrahymena thermophila SB210]
MGVYLSAPKREKTTVVGQGNGFVYAASSMQGWRVSMEDADICCPNLDNGIQLYGVFDGHGGQEVSSFVQKNFSEQLLNNTEFQQKDFTNALIQNFMKMDELLRSEEGKAQLRDIMKDKSKTDTTAGCTANVVLIHENTMYIANAGDSRTLLSQNGIPKRLSEDHKPDNMKEYQRIREAGGDVQNGRVNGNLNLSRALGDLQYKKNFQIPQDKQLIIAKPDVTIHKITPDDEFILIGCDGIWETLSDEEIIKYIRQQIALGVSCDKIVEQLLDLLLAPDMLNGCGCDNMTCILVTLQDYDQLKNKYMQIKEFQEADGSQEQNSSKSPTNHQNQDDDSQTQQNNAQNEQSINSQNEETQ